MSRLVLFALVCLPMVWPQAVRAYCRTSTCSDCPRDPETGCTVGGKHVSWPTSCVSLNLQADASDQVDLQTVRQLLHEAFATWQNARCDKKGRHPSIHLKPTGGLVVCPRSEYFPHQSGANVLVFRDTMWPYTGVGTDELALTRVRFAKNGDIVDADLEINTTFIVLTGDAGTGGGFIPGAHDLLSIMVHEVGHFLGLDHSMDPTSVMQPALPPRVVRTKLGDDDVAAICAIYPPDRKAAPCDPEPPNGFSAQCALDPTTGGACNAVPGSPSRSPQNLSAMLLVLAVLGLRRRRGRRR